MRSGSQSGPNTKIRKRLIHPSCGRLSSGESDLAPTGTVWEWLKGTVWTSLRFSVSIKAPEHAVTPLMLDAQMSSLESRHCALVASRRKRGLQLFHQVGLRWSPSDLGERTFGKLRA